MTRSREDDCFHSPVLLASRATRRPTDSGVRIAYDPSVSPYVAVVDPDHDGHPEPLASAASGPIDDCENYVRTPHAPLASAVREYRTMVGAYDGLNFTHGGMPEYPLFNLALDRTARLLRAEPGRLVDVTAAFSTHRRWRRATLLAWADSSSADTARARPWLPAAERLDRNAGIVRCVRGLRALAQSIR